jgi:hypothetical protein
MGPLFRSNAAERSIRSKLLQQGCVETVAVLPGKMLPHTSIPLVLWVLCRSGESANPGTVLLIDASQAKEPENQVSRWLDLGSGSDPEDCPQYARVDIRDLLADDAVLQPNRWIVQPDVEGNDLSGRYTGAVRDLKETAARLATATVPAESGVHFSAPRIVTVKEISHQGVASLKQGRIVRSEAEILGLSIVTSSDIRNGLPVMDKANKNSSKTESPQHVVTETGDVLVTTTNTIRAVVDLQGGRFLANGVYRLRLDTTRCNPAYVAFCLQAQWNQDQLMGSGILRADIKSLEIPLIPLDEQQQVVALLSAMADAQRDAETAAAAARTMTGVVLDAVRYDVSMALGNE